MPNVELIEKIEEMTDLSFNKKEHKRLQKRFEAKTTVQAMQGFRNASNFVVNFGQFLSIVLGAGIPIMLAERMPNIALFSFALGWVILISLEIGKRYSIQKANDIRILNGNQNNQISNTTYNVSSFLLILCSMGISYFGAPYVVNYFASHKPLLELSSIENEFNEKKKESSAYWHDLKNNAEEKAKQIHTENSWKGKTSREARTPKLAFELQAAAMVDSLNSNLAMLAALENSAMFEAKEANKQIISSHQQWCNGFSLFGCCIAILIDLLVIVLCYWNTNFDERKLKENEAKLKIKEEENSIKGIAQEQAYRIHKEEEQSTKVEEKAKQKDTENEAPRAVGFHSQERKEGFIEKGEGKKRDRILVEVAGELRGLTLGQINTLISGQSTAERAKHLQGLRDLLIKNNQQ